MTNEPEISAATTNTNSYELPASVSIENIEFLHSEISTLNHSGGLVLDATKLESITTPGVQLFVALNKKLEDGGCTLSLINAGETVINAFEALGFNAQLTKWSKANG